MNVLKSSMKETEWVDKTSWSDGKIEGDVFRKMVKGSLKMFFATV